MYRQPAIARDVRRIQIVGVSISTKLWEVSAGPKLWEVSASLKLWGRVSAGAKFLIFSILQTDL